MRTHLPHLLAAGFLSAVLYIAVFSLGLGFLFLFLPTLPLFWVGLSVRPKAALQAGLVAALALLVVIGPGAAAMHWLSLTLPTWYLCYQSAKRVKLGDFTLWFPLGNAFATITAFACGLMVSVAIDYMGTEGGLGKAFSSLVSAIVAPVSKDMGEQVGGLLKTITSEYSFLIIAITFWMWMLCLLLHGWLANRLLVKANKAIRPHFFITPFPLPHWLLHLLLIAALASVIGGPSLAFAGKACFMMLLFPYFLHGCSMMHHHVAKWPNRLLFLFFVYFLLFALLWPVLLLVGMGLWQQLISVNKHLSAGGTSSKS